MYIQTLHLVSISSAKQNLNSFFALLRLFRAASTRGAIRTKLKMSQTAFAACFGILPSAIGNGIDAIPMEERVLLMVIDRNRTQLSI
jgi:hypothetical protein